MGARSVVGSTVGGASTGASAGGPVGAAVGAGVGLVTGLFGGGGPECGPDNRQVLQGSLQGVQVEDCSGVAEARERAGTVEAAMAADPGFARSVRQWWANSNPTACPAPRSDRVHALYVGWVSCGGWNPPQRTGARRLLKRAQSIAARDGGGGGGGPVALAGLDTETILLGGLAIGLPALLFLNR